VALTPRVIATQGVQDGPLETAVQGLLALQVGVDLSADLQVTSGIQAELSVTQQGGGRKKKHVNPLIRVKWGVEAAPQYPAIVTAPQRTPEVAEILSRIFHVGPKPEFVPPKSKPQQTPAITHINVPIPTGGLGRARGVEKAREMVGGAISLQASPSLDVSDEEGDELMVLAALELMEF
jgi:hypothetical protein